MTTLRRTSDYAELLRLRKEVVALRGQIALHTWSQDQQITLAAREYVQARRRMIDDYSPSNQRAVRKALATLERLCGEG